MQAPFCQQAAIFQRNLWTDTAYLLSPPLFFFWAFINPCGAGIKVKKTFETYAAHVCDGAPLVIAGSTGQVAFTREQQHLVVNKGDIYESKIDVLITTPGRLVDHINSTRTC